MASLQPQTEPESLDVAPAQTDEIAQLRARVAALEAELAEVHTRANAAIAAAEDRAYWLDRWHLDLNELMRRPGASEFRAAVRGARVVFRAARKASRKLRA
jgi:putative SOS response-associated peptidase YedK